MMLEEGGNVISLALLHESPVNPRSISDERFDALKHALEADPDMMRARPIIATTEGEVVCGNMRLRALKDMGWTEAPVFVAKLDDNRRREWMLRDNQEYGDWVPDELAALIAEHAAADADMTLLGFGDEKIDSLLALATPDADGDGTGDGGDPPIDVWGIVVECDTEDQQASLLDELVERGLTVRALIT